MRAWLFAAVVAALAGNVRAGSESADAFAWLQKMATATHRLNYTGVFVYQRGDKVETSRIIHRVDESGEHAKLVSLDGSPREMYRINDDVLCLLPDGKSALLDRSRAKKLFPAILPERIAELSESYEARLAGSGRVAGRQAQIVVLRPRDGYRYGHKYWADQETGLLLQANVWKGEGEMVDRFAFTQITIGAPIPRGEVKPPLKGRHVIRHEVDQDGAIDPGWTVGSVPPGFKRISAMKRMLPGHRAAVNHIVYSDGLAAVSVFIEPASGTLEPGLSQRGAFHAYARVVADHDVKVLGEVPAATVLLIGDSITYTRP